MSEILAVHGREILDSRGRPTLEVEVLTSAGHIGRAAVPSGASTGKHEAHELRDEDNTRFFGKGVLKAAENVAEKIAPELVGEDCLDQTEIDDLLITLDGSPNKTNLGANALLGVSLAVCKAAAEELNMPLYRYVGGVKGFRLPVPLMNVLNGGAHADNGLDVQEFMIVPNVDGSYRESLRAGCEIFEVLKKILSEKGLSTAVGDEGGFSPRLKSNQQALDLLMSAIEKAGYRPGEDIFLALDVAATELYKDDQYLWEGKKLSSAELLDVYSSWQSGYPLVSIEDAFAEDDWSAWTQITQTLGSKLNVVGDDLFVTNPERVAEGLEKGAANALLVKVNQIGTLTETIHAVELARTHQMKTVMSHRSGETEDVTIADLAVGLSCEYIKTGSLCRGERTAKYNQLLRIEESLGEQATYWGSLLY